MKVLLIASLFMSVAFAADSSKKAKMFAEHKTHLLESVDKNIEILNSFKSCVSAATEKKAVKVCRDKKRTEMKSLKKSRRKSKKK